MNSKTIISVVIPVKNRHKLLRETLSSVICQDLPKNVDLHIIVVDNLSTPPISLKFKKEFPKVNFVKNNIPDSPSGTRNVGLRYAKGDYIAFLDSDDLWEREFIKKSYKALKDTDASGITCIPAPMYQMDFELLTKLKIIIFNVIKEMLLLVYYSINNHRLPKSAFYLTQLSQTLFRSHPKVKFDEAVYNTEDWDFIIRKTIDNELLIFPKKLIKYRYHAKSTTFTDKVKRMKTRSYSNLIKNLPKSHGVGFEYLLFRVYVKLFLIR